MLLQVRGELAAERESAVTGLAAAKDQEISIRDKKLADVQERCGKPA